MSRLFFIFEYLHIEVSIYFLSSRYAGTYSDVVDLHGNQTDARKVRTISMSLSASEKRTDLYVREGLYAGQLVVRC